MLPRKEPRVIKFGEYSLDAVRRLWVQELVSTQALVLQHRWVPGQTGLTAQPSHHRGPYCHQWARAGSRNGTWFISPIFLGTVAGLAWRTTFLIHTPVLQNIRKKGY